MENMFYRLQFSFEALPLTLALIWKAKTLLSRGSQSQDQQQSSNYGAGFLLTKWFKTTFPG